MFGFRMSREQIQARLSAPTPWYRITNLAEDGVAEIEIYDEIGWLGCTASEFIAQLKDVDARQINLRVNSPGGEIFDGIAIHNALRSHPARVVTSVDSLAASIASVIALAGDEIVMMPHSQMMIHDGAGICMGQASDMREMADLLDRQSDNIASIYAEKAGGQTRSWRSKMKAETWYTAEEAVRAGLADRLAKLTRRPAEAEKAQPAAAHWDLSVFRYSGRDAAPSPSASTGSFTFNATSGSSAVTINVTVDGETTLTPDQVSDHLAKLFSAETNEEQTLIADKATPVHHTATVDETWDSGPNVSRLPSPMATSTANAMYAYYDAEQVENGKVIKGACKLPHHNVSTDGTPGAANLNGVRNALARLSQADIPASEHDAIRSHLQAHLDDAETEGAMKKCPQCGKMIPSEAMAEHMASEHSEGAAEEDHADPSTLTNESDDEVLKPAEEPPQEPAEEEPPAEEGEPQTDGSWDATVAALLDTDAWSQAIAPLFNRHAPARRHRSLL